MTYLRCFLTVLASATCAFGTPVNIVSPEFRGAIQPQVAVAPGGKIHVVFGRDGIVYHCSSPDGVTFSAPVQVGSLEKLALGMRRGPRITATNDLVLISAISHADGLVHTWLSSDAGKSWTAGSVLNTVPTSAREGLQALTGDGRGQVAAAWLDLRNGKMELWSRMSRDGGRTWQPEQMIYAAPEGPICQCCHPSLAFGPGGTLAAMWRNSVAGSRDLWLAVSSDGGRTFPEPVKLGTGTWTLNACPMDGGSITFDAQGKPAAVWRRERSVFASDAGNPEQRIAASAAQPVIAIGRSGRWLVWEEQGALHSQHAAEPATVLTRQGHAAALAALPDGRVFAVWENTTPGAAPLSAEILP
jgi:hypothetical protein